MASNYNRKSASSGSSRKRSTQKRSTTRSAARSTRTSSRRRSTVNSSSRRARSQRTGYSNAPQGYTSVRIGDMDKREREKRKKGRIDRGKKTQRRSGFRFGIVAAIVGVLLVGGVSLYFSPLFTVTNVEVEGIEHLTALETTNLVAVPEGTTLLRSNASGIKSRMLENPWIQDVKVRPVFPDTLKLIVTERPIAAVIDIGVDNAQNTEQWAIAADGMWIMSIPKKDSKSAAAVSSKVYEDAEKALIITGVPYGTAPQAGTYSTDETVNNALAIINGLTTELAGQIKKVEATGSEATTLTLENGIEIAFGAAEDIREKERVCLELMEKYPDSVAYINVRVVERPTYRAIGA